MSNYSVKKIIRNTDTYCVNGGGGVVANPYGDGSDGDLTVTGTCYLEAKEYNFANLNMCGYLRFYGDGVPVIRVCGTTNLCSGAFCLNQDGKCSGWLTDGTHGNYYARLGGHTNIAPTGCVPEQLPECRMCRGGYGNGRGGDQSSAGCANTFNGSTRCAGGAANGVNGGGGGGYSTAGSAATASAGGAGGSSTFSNISFDAEASSSCNPGSGGGGYGSTTGGRGGDMSLTNVSTVNCWGEWPESGNGGCSACCGGCGGNLTVAGLTNVSACAGQGGNGGKCGGKGGCVCINAGTINSYSSATQCCCSRYIRGGNGGCANCCGGCGGSIYVCGNLVLCGTGLIGGDGGTAYCGNGGAGGCVYSRNVQLCACNYVGPSTLDPTLKIKGGNGGLGRYGGSGGGVQISCCNSFLEMGVEGGRGGDGVCRGGDGGSAFIGGGVTAYSSTGLGTEGVDYDIRGGDGGNVVGGMYDLTVATNVLCVCRGHVSGSGGNGGKGGNATSNAACPLCGRAGNGGNGGNGGNMSLIYGTYLGCPLECISYSVSGGCGGLQGNVCGNIHGPAARNGFDGKDGCVRIMQFKM